MRSRTFATLAENLLREGVAPRHVRRTVAELKAHRQDLMAELQARGASEEDAAREAVARLGSDAALAASVLARPELRSWARKCPWFAFALIPVVWLMVALAGAVAGFILLVSGLQALFGASLLQHASMLRPASQMLPTATVWILPIVVAGSCAAFAARHRAGVAWPIAGVVLIALLGATTNMGFEWPVPPSHGSVSAGLGFSTDHPTPMLLRAGTTMALVLGPFLTWRFLSSRRLRSVS